MTRRLLGTGSFILAALLVAGLLSGTAIPARADTSAKDEARAITDQIICPCSCGEVLTGCTCDTGKSMKAFVDSSVKSGKGKDEVMGALVSQYGEVVRGAPKAQGFNLIVWIAPFAATLLGLVIAAVILRRWVRRPVPAVATVSTGGAMPPVPSSDEELDELRARAEDELRRLRE
jgi:cytochrome c-type biogenesis protein CcmH